MNKRHLTPNSFDWFFGESTAGQSTYSFIWLLEEPTYVKQFRFLLNSEVCKEITNKKVNWLEKSEKVSRFWDHSGLRSKTSTSEGLWTHFFSGPARTTGTCLESFCNLYPTWYFLKSTFEIQANRVPYFVMHSVHKGFQKKSWKYFLAFSQEFN